MKKVALLVFVYIGSINLFIIQAAMAQELAGGQITGTVREEGSGKPIVNVNVFFDGTMNGTATDSSGNFTLYPRTSVKLPILVSNIGYYSKTITDYSLDQKLMIDLKIRSYDLDAVTVKAFDGMTREEEIKIFKREFLGTNSNAKNCEILNEDDLRFTYSSKTRIFKAFCDKPLIIHNKNLGYVLNFLLASFTYAGGQTAFSGAQFFREDPNLSDIEKIKKARKRTYLGSDMHFIRSIWEGRLAENGFEIYKKRVPIISDSLIVTNNDQKYLRINGIVGINYHSQISYMEGTATPVLIDKNGYFDPNAGVVWTGMIGMQRVGDMLPMEYTDESFSRKSKEQTNNQSNSFTASVLLDTLRSRMPQEKLYIHLDKAYYSTGDTIRMKAYLLDAAEGKGSEKSGIVYVELANDSNKVLYRRMLPVGFGLGTGNIVLNKDDIPEGSYMLRAYTNLMRNFGEEAIFSKNLYISGSIQNWLVNSKTILSQISGKDNLRLALQFNLLNNRALMQQDLDLRVVDGKKVLQRDKVQTDIDGKLDVNFNLPDQVDGKNLSMIVSDPKDSNRKVKIPITVNRPENIDLQFMPEGGNLVAGITSRVGFKAIGEDGNGVEVSGKIYTADDEEVAAFSSSHKGMGSFEFKPKFTTPYKARIMVGVTPKTFPLPGAKNIGSVLRITNSQKSDSLKATIVVLTNLTTTSAVAYHLIGQAGGKVFYEAEIPVNGNISLTKSIAKNIFPTGSVRFTLMNADRQPLNERVVFINHYDNLEISLQPAKASYQTRDSISVAIEVKDSEGRPVEGSFSLAVTDDSQVHLDSLSANILTSMLLTSGLKGTIEDPGHYLQETAQAGADLDNLLLTQGWIGYDWKGVFNPPAMLIYPPEPEFLITGTVNSAFNKKSPSSAIQLLSLKPSVTKIAVTGQDGSFSFGGFPVNENMQFFLQAKNKNGKSFNVGIRVDEFKPAEFKSLNQRLIPWYVNSDTALLRQVNTRVTQQEQLIAKGVNMLEEVTIAGKKAVKDSKNLNGAGEADQTLNDEDIAKTPKKSLLDLMQENIRGFTSGVWPSKNVMSTGIQVEGINGFTVPILKEGRGSEELSKTAKGTVAMAFSPIYSYMINGKEMHLIIDGVDIETLYQPTPGQPLPTSNIQLRLQKEINPAGDYILERNTASPTDRQNFIKAFLDQITAEDVKGIEVMSNPQFNNRYKSKYATNILSSLSMIDADFAYVEVTTYSGNGAYVNTPVGTYLHKPMSFVNNAVFYKPKYTSILAPLTDFRSTIHWEPDIVTDKDGKAVVSFYSTDRTGTYSIIIEGSNMNGNVGRQVVKVHIKN